MRVRIWCFLVVFCIVATCCGSAAKEPRPCGSGTAQSHDKGFLTLGVDETYPPFAFDDGHGTGVGLEIDIGRALAETMKLKFALVNRTSSVLVPLVLAHRFDVVASGFLDSQTLRRQVCMTIPYMSADLAVLVPAASSIRGAGDIRGHRVAVLAGGRAADWTKQHMPDVGVTVYQAEDDVLSALRAGTVDVAVDDVALARFAQKRTDGALKVAGTIGTGEHYVLATSNDNGGLTTELDAALARLQTNGKLAEIEHKWLGG